MEEMANIKEVLLDTVRKAGGQALSHMGKIKEVTRKGDYSDIVTDVDKACEKLIIDNISSHFPEHSVLAEEGGRRDGKGSYRWVIDPIDGTTNYSHGFPFFCSSIGVMREGEPVAGAVYDPFRDELFFAEKEKGAYLNDQPISVSGTEVMKDSLIATGFAYNVSGRVKVLPYLNNVITHAQAVRRAGSAALDLCYVACGRLDGFWEFGLNPWDTAAGYLLVKEAGGTVTKIDGLEYDIFSKELVATNGVIQKEMLAVLNESNIKM